jgi:hypothetical protein
VNSVSAGLCASLRLVVSTARSIPPASSVLKGAKFAVIPPPAKERRNGLIFQKRAPGRMSESYGWSNERLQAETRGRHRIGSR